jgi:2-hydroxy-3-keto-5-methylthiopentenyl-1-phosphate phosphatase
LELKVIQDLDFYLISIYIIDEYVAQKLNNLNQASRENAIQLSEVQETIQSAVDHITKFLFDQVDFEAVHRDAMLKVNREELQEKQNPKVPA